MGEAQDVLPSFGDLAINTNGEGWGPSDIPNNFKDMPYQPFSKDTRLGKIADWCGSIYTDNKSKNRYTSQFGGGAQYTYYHDDDDSNFQLATGGKDPRSSAFRQRFKFQMRGRNRGNFQQGRGGPNGMYNNASGGRQRRPYNDRGGFQQNQQGQRRYGNQQGWQNYRRGGAAGAGGNWGGGWRGGDFNRRQNRGNKNPSVEIKEEWTLLEEFEFSQFASLSLPTVKDPITCAECGLLKYYNRDYDTVTTRTERPLVRFGGVVHTVSTSQDPVMIALMRRPNLKVFCTDRIAAALMCASKSVESWDLLVTRVTDKLFFDVRPGSNFEHVTVAETAVDPPFEEPGHINNTENLALEASFININFTQQVLHSDRPPMPMKQRNPFVDPAEVSKTAPENLTSVGYRYRQFDLGGGVILVVRCEVDAVIPAPASAAATATEKGKAERAMPPKYCCIKALNEFDSRYCNGVNWRSKLDTQRGAVIASELKNNSCKLARWTVSSILAGAELLKFGFVSRVSPKDSSHHVILGTHEFRPADFASQINLNMDNAWGTLRCIIDYFMRCDEGQYLMLKDPNKQALQIYSVPANAFGSDDEDDEEEEDSEDSSDEDDGDSGSSGDDEAEDEGDDEEEEEGEDSEKAVEEKQLEEKVEAVEKEVKEVEPPKQPEEPKKEWKAPRKKAAK